VDVIDVTLRIAPGELAVNRAWRKTDQGMRRSDRYKDAVKAVSADLRDVAAAERWRYRGFPVGVEIEAHWPDHVGDVDAPIKGILDAIQKAGIVQDDAQVVRIAVAKFMNSDDPRICIKVAHVDLAL
jgi:Holliday junction resolvase RusA-like endonuclease